MEKRREKRKIVNIPAEVLCGDKYCAGTIENISESGIYLVTAPQKALSDLPVDTPVEIRFTFPSGEKQILHCRLRWSYLTPPHGFTQSIGVEILDPSPVYKALLQSLP